MGICFLAKADLVPSQHYICFYGDTIIIPASTSKPIYEKPITEQSISAFYETLEQLQINVVADTLMNYRKRSELDDWLFYQVIRAAAEQMSPKAENYERYTLYKWYLLNKTGFSSIVTITPGKVLLYVQSDEEVYEIPFRSFKGKQSVCLNYHDYGEIDFTKERFKEVEVGYNSSGVSFSYKINKLPDFSLVRYTSKELEFDYYQRSYKFNVLVNPDVQKIFVNYPILNYSYYFSMPMSHVTYSSLIPMLKQYLVKLDQRKGVDYLMRFTRNSFSFAADTKQFGKEKRLTPEQTLLYGDSDCEDRAAFFFYLVKEIYDLPMIVLCFENHVTVAVAFDKKMKKHSIAYKGKNYYVCEPTPQAEDLSIGELPSTLRKASYEIVYEYKSGGTASSTASANR